MEVIANFSADVVGRVAPVLLAPFIGSFLGVLIVRLPAGRPVAMARSACDHCGHRLGCRDLIPLVSYALSRGRCRYCGEAIGPFPVAIELAALGVALWAVIAVDDAPWVACLFGWTLLTLAWIDQRTMILPDALTLPLLVFGLAATGISTPELLPDHLLSAALGYVSLAGVAWAYRRFRGREGLGMGDAKLLAAIGAFLGLSLLPLVLLLAACSGLAAAGVAALAGRRMTAATALPFGPFLALSGWLLFLYADRITDWLMDGAFGSTARASCCVEHGTRPTARISGNQSASLASVTQCTVIPASHSVRFHGAGRITITMVEIADGCCGGAKVPVPITWNANLKIETI